MLETVLLVIYLFRVVIENSSNNNNIFLYGDCGGSREGWRGQTPPPPPSPFLHLPPLTIFTRCTYMLDRPPPPLKILDLPLGRVILNSSH